MRCLCASLRLSDAGMAQKCQFPAGLRQNRRLAALRLLDDALASTSSPLLAIHPILLTDSFWDRL